MSDYFCFQEIEEQFGHYRTQNESKNIFKAFSYFVCSCNFFLLCVWILRLTRPISFGQLSQSHDGLDSGDSLYMGLHQVRRTFLFLIAIFRFRFPLNFSGCITKFLARSFFFSFWFLCLFLFV
jgi:hypothetical protein